ncbi:MAG: hypothetical protein ACRC5T_05085 [Cetobacterium sp.]
MPTLEKKEEMKNHLKEERLKIENLGKTLRKGIVLGLDLSINGPGLAIVDFNSYKVLYVDNFPNKNKDKESVYYYRYIEIKLWLEDIFSKFLPEVIVIEEAHMSALTAKSNVPLLNIHGYIGHLLQSKGANVLKIAPSSSRSFLSIKPNKKEVAFEWVKVKFPEIEWGSFSRDNDKADAIILALNAKNLKCKQIQERQ